MICPHKIYMDIFSVLGKSEIDMLSARDMKPYYRLYKSPSALRIGHTTVPQDDTCN